VLKITAEKCQIHKFCSYRESTRHGMLNTKHQRLLLHDFKYLIAKSTTLREASKLMTGVAIPVYPTATMHAARVLERG